MKSRTFATFNIRDIFGNITNTKEAFLRKNDSSVPEACSIDSLRMPITKVAKRMLNILIISISFFYAYVCCSSPENNTIFLRNL